MVINQNSQLRRIAPGGSTAPDLVRSTDLTAKTTKIIFKLTYF